MAARAERGGRLGARARCVRTAVDAALEGGAGLVELNANVGVVSLDGSLGPESIVVFGAVRSIAQVKLAGVASVLPAPSVACTSKVWVPPLRRLSVSGRGARRPAAAVDAALEARAGLGRAEVECRRRVTRRIARVGVDRRVGRRQVDRPGVARGGGVGVAGVSVARTSKVWLPAPSAASVLGRGAGRPAAAVDAALEGRAGLGGAEREGGGGVVGRVVRRRVDRGVRCGEVDRPGVARGGGVGVAGRVGGADVEGVAAGAEGGQGVGRGAGAQLPLSMRHSKVEPASVELKAKVGVVSLVGSFGVGVDRRVRCGRGRSSR